ncbi:hypothetical protein D9758_011833 [Tetrapyrgos nigripes]|uniref:Cytochrome P450 n=1 Tax=Tetrapyrgos nigripes TaxID=182062 RepID=A0A8H5CL03_9AGAR|nr:hypothetical protein D9758_011833 [Tetrapyrgos nigripes]
MIDLRSIGYLLAGIGGTYLVFSFLREQIDTYKLRHIPTIGPKGLFSSYFGRFQFVKRAKDMLQEGYEKYPGGLFKIRTLDQWIVIVTNDNMIHDIRKAPENMMSFDFATRESFQQDHTMGKTVYLHPHHVDVVRTTLTKNIAARFSDVQDEIASAFGDEIPPDAEWKPYPTLNTVMRIICRTTNRLFVGLPVCRDLDYINLNIEHTILVFKSAFLINLFPSALHQIVGPLLSPLPASLKRARKHLAKMIEERIEKDDQYGRDWDGRPNDFISWILDEIPQEKQKELRNVEDILLWVLHTNIGAIHTTSMAFTNILYHLAIQPPEVLDILRNEMESAIDQYGWTKDAMSHMRRTDSFMKEVARMVGTNGTVVERMAMKDFTFSDGTTLPAGSRVAVPGFVLQRDENRYQDADKFKPFRFYDMDRDSAGLTEDAESTWTGSIKHQMTTPSPNYFFFGTGKHACPGRFFAVNELKTLVAHTLLHYDIKLEGDAKSVPAPVWLIRDISPDANISVMFRKRQRLKE